MFPTMMQFEIVLYPTAHAPTLDKLVFATTVQFTSELLCTALGEQSAWRRLWFEFPTMRQFSKAVPAAAPCVSLELPVRMQFFKVTAMAAAPPALGWYPFLNVNPSIVT